MDVVDETKDKAAEVGRTARHHTRKHGEWVRGMARFGYAAKGLLYISLGSIAARASFGSDRPEGWKGTVTDLLGHPIGALLVAVIALGLFGYASWRLLRAVANPESDHVGSRIYSVFTAIVHYVMFGTVVSAIFGSREDGGDAARLWTARAFAQPMGRWLVLAVAIGLVTNGLWQIFKAARGKIDDDLQLYKMSEAIRKMTFIVARAGMTARGVVFGLIGLSLLFAAVQVDPSEAHGLDRMLESILDRRFGQLWLAAVASGFIAYGIYELTRATYRRVKTG